MYRRNMGGEPYGLALNLKKLAYLFETKFSCLSNKDNKIYLVIVVRIVVVIWRQKISSGTVAETQ